MKYLKAVLLLLLLIPFTGQSQSKRPHNNFSLNGQLTGRDSGIILLRYYTRGNEILDTAKVVNGAFHFEGYVFEPTNAELIGNTEDKIWDVNDPNLVEVFLEPALMTVGVEINKFKEANVTGSVTQKEVDELISRKQNVYRQIDSTNILYRKYKAIIESGGDKQTVDNAIAEKKKISLAGNRSMDALKAIDYNFIKTHPNSFNSPIVLINYLYSNQLPADSARMFYNSFTSRVKSGDAAKAIARKIISKETSAIGQIASDFTRKDYKGKLVTLSSFKNKKYVLLDFWASWCIPCREFTPQVKAMNAKYHDKGLQIISVSLDTKSINWKKAIAEDGIKIWPQLLAYEDLPEKPGFEKESNIARKYNVQAIPVLILINKTWKIIGRYHDQNEQNGAAELESELAEIFKNQ